LIGVLRLEFHDRLSDDAGLFPGIVEIDGVGALARADVVDAAEKVVGVPALK
jgi:hypothetical protein